MEKYVRHLDDLVIDEKEYAVYLGRWLEGIKSESVFWKHFIETKGIEWNTDWDELISNDRSFGLDEYLSNELVFKKLSEIIVADAYKNRSGKMRVLYGIVKKIPFLGYWARKIYKRYKKAKNLHMRE